MSTPTLVSARRFVTLPRALALLILLAAAALPAGAATDLYFSEYIEGTSNNKALEIYNGTGAIVRPPGAGPPTTAERPGAHR